MELPDIKKALKDKGFKLGMAAERLGISKNSMTEIAKRRRMPRFEVIRRLSQLTEIPIEQLYPETAPESSLQN